MMIYSFLMKILVKSHFLLRNRYLFGVDLDKIILDDDNNFYRDDPHTIIFPDVWLCVINSKNAKQGN